MNKSTHRYRTINAIAPWLTLAALLSLSAALPNRVALDGQAELRKEQIAQAVASAPFFIGPWIGQDTPVLREAQELLRPNAILSRTYQRPGGVNLHLLMVHCSDARDMIGHYPPICYPSSGWVPAPAPASGQDIQIAIGEIYLPMRTYLFRRVQEHGAEEVVRVFSAFILPDGTMTRGIADINRQSERLAVSVRGVAQLQIVSDIDLDQEQAQEGTAELLAGMPELLKALGIDQGGTYER